MAAIGDSHWQFASLLVSYPVGEAGTMISVWDVEMLTASGGGNSRGRVCHYVPIATERARRCIRP
jgi:hypothetical protein